MAQNCILSRYNKRCNLSLLISTVQRYNETMYLLTKKSCNFYYLLLIINVFFQKLDQNSFWFIGFVRASSRFNELLTTKFKMTSTTISY